MLCSPARRLLHSEFLLFLAYLGDLKMDRNNAFLNKLNKFCWADFREKCDLSFTEHWEEFLSVKMCETF